MLNAEIEICHFGLLFLYLPESRTWLKPLPLQDTHVYHSAYSGTMSIDNACDQQEPAAWLTVQTWSTQYTLASYWLCLGLERRLKSCLDAYIARAKTPAFCSSSLITFVCIVYRNVCRTWSSTSPSAVILIAPCPFPTDCTPSLKHICDIGPRAMWCAHNVLMLMFLLVGL